MTRTETGKEGTTGMSGTGNIEKKYKVLREGSVVRLINRNTAIALWKNKHNTEKIYMIFDESGKYPCDTEKDLYSDVCSFALYCGKIWDINDEFNKLNGLKGYGFHEKVIK